MPRARAVFLGGKQEPSLFHPIKSATHIFAICSKWLKLGYSLKTCYKKVGRAQILLTYMLSIQGDLQEPRTPTASKPTEPSVQLKDAKPKVDKSEAQEPSTAGPQTPKEETGKAEQSKKELPVISNTTNVNSPSTRTVSNDHPLNIASPLTNHFTDKSFLAW